MKLIYALIASFMVTTSFAQLNISLLGQLDLVQIHNSDGNDIWAHVDGSGNEYAIMGLNDGTSIVDITNPAAPVEVFYEPGMNSIWRDIKTYGNYAYVTTEAANGLLIIDMSSLPNASGISTTYYTGPSGDQWESAHNLYIDSVGICYIFGANRDVGGCIMLDIATNPMSPIEIGKVENWYAHDGVARGGLLYMGHINDGFMSIFDVSVPSAPVLLGTKNTPGNFSHNVWFSDNSQYVFTTDEISDGFIGAYDISDPLNMIELDKTQSSPGQDVIPHNTHFINDYIVTSYYRDGVTIHDVSDPSNMIEVGNFDTSPLSGDGFNGCWGAYPWLPSGNIILSDIESGLFILGPTYTRGCYLEGQITDAITSGPISNASIKVLTTTNTDNSNLTGNYTSGLATAGSYSVEVSKFGYITQTITGVMLSNGNTTVLNVQLVPVPSFDVTGTIDDNGSPIGGAMVTISSNDTTYTVLTDGNGDYIANGVYDGTYTVTAGKWGFVTECVNITVNGASVIQNFSLSFGYYDDFSLDFNWTTSSLGASTGYWVREYPIGTQLGGSVQSNPEDDVIGDCGDKAFITGNAGGQAGFDDVDDGDVDLQSPVFDATLYTVPVIQFSTWWVNAGGSGIGDDVLTVSITDGSTTVELVNYDGNSLQMAQWISNSFILSDFMVPSANMQILVHTEDGGDGHIVEAGIDAFKIIETLAINEEEHLVKIYPNPFTNEITCELSKNDIGSKISITDIQGKIIYKGLVQKEIQNIQLDVNLPSGVYVIEIQGEKSQITRKLVK